MTVRRVSMAVVAMLLAAACGGGPEAGSQSAASTELPLDGTCEAGVMLTLVNEASLEVLDDDVALDARAAENIVEARPIETMIELDAVSYVGPSALWKIFEYVEDEGLTASCASGPEVVEIGIVSDLDKTVVPPGDPDLSVAPYPGVTRLYQILELELGEDGGAGVAGDVYYVTARQPESVEQIPAYLEDHGVPGGPIETGVSGLPWVAEPEKVADVSGILDATGEQRFLLFGDSSHRDPEVYQTIRELYGDRIVAGFIHKVNATVSEDRVEGLHLHESYAEVAALLYGYGVLSREQALEVMVSAQQEGLAITPDEMETLLDQHAP